MAAPLDGLRVLDFSTLVPGPLATLILAEAGADVVKVERPAGGDIMREYEPKFGTASSNFALLNRGKRSITADLRSDAGLERVLSLALEADVVVEQFRPGVMRRLRLSYEDIVAENPSVVYCSVTSFGQEGERAMKAAHDLNFMAMTGALSLVSKQDGTPSMPITPFGDIAAGSFPAVVNILLALFSARATGRGTHLDISMSDNLFTYLYWALGEGWSSGDWPAPNSGLVTGGTPRYGLYETSDGRFVAAAPLEQQFWEEFCELVGVETRLQTEQADHGEVRRAVAAGIAARTANHWERMFEGRDVCCTVVRTLEEAVRDPYFVARGVFSREVADPSGELTMPALPVPLDEQLRNAETLRRYPDTDDPDIRWLSRESANGGDRQWPV
jgi:alpha-methylacyl-CoA racemase